MQTNHSRGMRALALLVPVLALVVAGCVPRPAATPVKKKAPPVVVHRPPVVTKKPTPVPPRPAAPPVSKPVSSPPVAAIPAPDPGDWTGQFADDAATADNPYETSITTDNVQSLHEVWSAPSGRSPTFPTSPLVAGGLVFDTDATPATIYTYKTALSAYDLESGAVRWQRTLQSDQQLIGLTDGLVLVANPDFRFGSEVQAFDQKTGAPQWTWDAPVGGQILGTVITGSGHLFVPIAGGLYALDPSDGHQLFVITCTVEDGPNCLFNLGNGVAASGDLIYSGGFESTAGFEFSAVDGHRINPLGRAFPQGALGAPVISGNQVFVSGWASSSVGDVAGYSTTPCGKSFCTPEWEVQVPGGASRLAFADGRVFVVNDDGLVEALNPANGQVLWQGQFSPADGGYLSVAGDVLYVTSGLTISAFPAAGCAAAANCEPLWQYTVPDHTQLLDAPAVVTGGRLLYANFSGLHALAVKTQ